MSNIKSNIIKVIASTAIAILAVLTIITLVALPNWVLVCLGFLVIFSLVWSCAWNMLQGMLS